MAPIVPPAGPPYPINLPAALRLAETVNPVIAEARAHIGEALGLETQARVLMLPTLSAGGNYHDHTGQLQRSDGQILNVSQQLLYFGGGTGAVSANTIGTGASAQTTAASTPAVLIVGHIGDAIFDPLEAHQVVEATRFDAAATANDVLLGVATDYLGLQGTNARLQARQRTELEAAELARITLEYARTGQGRQADADRAGTEWKLRRASVRDAEGQIAVASARLVRRLHLDPALRVDPAGDPLQVFTLIKPDSPVEELLQIAIRQRPEVHARAAQVGQAEYRLRHEQLRPLLPNIWVSFSSGVLGGGSNLAPPSMGDFRGRTDFDVFAYWSLRNFGLGNLTIVKQRRAELGETAALQARTINRVRDEVAAARAEILTRREQIAVALGEITVAWDGFQKDLDRIRQAAGPPLEVLDNLRYLASAREALIDAVVGYNQAQFRLYVALGSPPPLQSPTEAAPPARISAILASAPAGTNPSVPGREIGARVSGSDPPPTPASARPDAAAAPPAALTLTLPVPAAAGPVRTTREGLEALARAHQDSVQAMTEYDRLQVQLLNALGAARNTVPRDELRERLTALAEAHRKVLSRNADYDRALWQLFTAQNPRPPADEIRQTSGPAPSEEIPPH